MIEDELKEHFKDKNIIFKKTSKKISWSFIHKETEYKSFIYIKDCSLDNLFIYVKFFVIRHYYEIVNKKINKYDLLWKM